MENSFFIKNRKKIAEALEENSLLILFSGEAPYKSADEKYLFTPNKNFFYLTGIKAPKAIFLVAKKKGIIHETIFIEKSDPVLEKWEGKLLSVEETQRYSGIENVEFVNDFKVKIDKEFIENEYSRVYLDFEHRQWDAAIKIPQNFAKDLSARHPHLILENIHNKIAAKRTIKSKEEIEMIQKAIEITNRGIKSIMHHSKAGVAEYLLEAHFDYILKSEGVREHAFNAIIAAGKNATTLHYSSNNDIIEDNSLVLVDVGATYECYSGDITRTFPVNGTFTHRQKQLYNIVLKANEKVIEIIKPGVEFKKLNEMAKKILAQGCKEAGIIKQDSELDKYYYHSVSHFLGLDTHDVGNRDQVLAAGMVITVEPGLYIAEEAIGIRIEDDVVVTEKGCQVLSADIIKKPEDIELFMKNNGNMLIIN